MEEENEKGFLFKGGLVNAFFRELPNLLRSVVDTHFKESIAKMLLIFFLCTPCAVSIVVKLELVARKDTNVSITQVLVASISHQYLMQYSRLRLKLLMLHSSFIMPFYETKVARMPLKLKKRFSKPICTPESRTRARSNGISKRGG